MGKETQQEPSTIQAREHSTRDDEWVRCTACGHALAPQRAGIDVEGKHVHTFVNPMGHEYTIRCFGDAPGCQGTGEESTFFTWFKGFAWQVALCAACGAHVGWSFRKEGGSFWGLIVGSVA
jgi:hypothetical protein